MTAQASRSIEPDRGWVAQPLADAASERWAVLICTIAATLGWLAWAGRDFSWDLQNHHLYLPFSLLSGRFSQDLFGAGPQAYQNPAGYIPFYLLARSGLPSWVVGGTMALVHAAVSWPLSRLCFALWAGHGSQRQWRWLALGLAWATPVFLLVLGTSSTDALAPALVLGSLVIVLCGSATWGQSLAAGALLGVALGIKPVNAAFALAIGGVLVLRCLAGQHRWRDLAIVISAALVSCALVTGAWCAWLWQAFGNPLFPLFNDIFASPYAPQQAIVATRFMPTAPLDYLTRPWLMASYRLFASTEELTPDLRPALLVVAGLPAMLVAGWRHWASAWRWPAALDVQLIAFAFLSYVFWLRTSGNARYAIPLLMVVGVLLVRAVQTLLPPSVARIGLLLALLMQMAYFGIDGHHRIGAARWDRGPYMDVRAAQRLVDEPFLHLSLGVLSYGAVAPYLHHGGAMVNLVGQMSIPPDGPLGSALRQRLERWRGRTRFLVAATLAEGRIVVPEKVRERGDALVYKYGLRFDFEDCEPIRLVRNDREGAGARGDVAIMSCAAVTRTLDDPNFEKERVLADQVFARIETSCPAVFSPTPMTSDNDLQTWHRRYINSDARISVSFSEGVALNHFRSLQIVYLGSVEDVLAGRSRDPCMAWHTEMFK